LNFFVHFWPSKSFDSCSNICFIEVCREVENVSKRMLRPGEVAELFKVNPKTVKRWVQANKLKAITTPGGHARFDFDYIMEMIKNSPKVLLVFLFIFI